MGPGFRQTTQERKRLSDTFEAILTKHNDLPLEDDRSTWTDYIIGDEAGREQYQLNVIKRRRPSYTSYVEETTVVMEDDDDDAHSYMEFTVIDDETLYEEETVYDEETIVSQARASFRNLRKSIKIASVNERANQITATTQGASDEDQSYMDFTMFDNDTVQVSYVEDDSNYVAPQEQTNAIFQEPRSLPVSAPVNTATIPVTGIGSTS